MENGIFLLSMLILLPISLLSQPTVFGTRLVNGSDYSTYDLTDKGVFRSVRLLASSTGTGRNWEFAIGTAGSPDYSTNWRPYTANQTLSGFDVKIDPVTQEASARYNSNPPGNSGLLPTITAGYYYTVNVGENGSGNNFMSIIETSFNPKSITGVSQGNVYVGGPVAVTITVSAALDGTEQVWVRYTTNGWSGSSFVQATGTGNVLVASIPGQILNSNVQYYVLSTKSTINLSHADADFQTLELNNNGGSNYSYTVNGSYANTTGGGCDGFWTTNACWLSGSPPPAGASVTILENLTMNTEADVTSITIQSNITLTVQSSFTLSIREGGTFACNGNFEPGDGNVIFSAIMSPPGNCLVTGSPTFANVTINGLGVDFGTGSTLQGILTILPDGFVNSGSPTYAPGSTLNYSTGAYYGRRSEWDQKTPHHVVVGAGTQLDMGANGGIGTARQCDGNLTVDANSGFYMDWGYNDMTQPVTVNGNVVNNGTISLSEASGGDLVVKGNFTQNGTFNCRERAVFFTGTSAQAIYGTQNVLIDYLIMDNNAGLTLYRDVTVDNLLTLSNGVINISIYNLNLESTATISVSGPNSSKMIQADGVGMLRKRFLSSGFFDYVIGSVGGPQGGYTPVSLNITNLGGNGYIGANVKVGKHPDNPSTNDYLKRYWTVIKDNGISFVFYDITCNYLPQDIVGLENNMRGARWNGSSWQPLNEASGNSFSGSALFELSDFTGVSESALPIELLSFQAHPHALTTLLTWRTATELNNSHFEVERSRDARTWEVIGSVPGHGTTLEAQDYRFTDMQPLHGLNYYRLRQVDYDGGFEYSPVVSVDFENGERPVVFFPNPAGDALFFLLPEQAEGPFTATITDLNGRVLHQATLAGNQLDIAHFAQGMYFFRLQDAGGQVIAWERFVKQ